MTGPVRIDAAEFTRLVGWSDAVSAVRRALAEGLDPATQPQRTFVTTATGQLILMPAEHGGAVGVKVLSVAPGNPSLDLPRIQATYTLMAADTLTPVALIDGTVLTTLRTPALAAVAADALAAADARTLVVFGTGPQAEGHVHAMRVIRPFGDVRIVGRPAERATAVVERLRADGVPAAVGTADDVAEADIVSTCTSARDPLFDGATVPEHAVVTAVGSHDPDARELDAALMGRARVVVEDPGTAMREAGDVVLAAREGALDPASLVAIGDLVRSTAPAAERRVPAVFKSVGQGWQDLVVAQQGYLVYREGSG